MSWHPTTFQLGGVFSSGASGKTGLSVRMDGVSSITFASITMLPEGSEPEIRNTGTPNHAVLHLYLPMGATGVGITGVSYVGQDADGTNRYELSLSDGTTREFVIPAAEQDRDKHYVHQQRTAAKDWSISHGLHKYPSVIVQDSAGTTVIGEVEYESENKVILHFAAPFAGVAYLN